MAKIINKAQAVGELVRRGISPRVLDLELAAAYVGLSAESFLDAVAAGRYPQPLPDGRRRQWDRVALDAAVDRRSSVGACLRKPETPDDIMAAIDAAS